MFRIGVNSAPKITSTENPEALETHLQQNVEQQVGPSESSLPAGKTSIRSEAMFSTVALRGKLTQQLDRHELMKSNAEPIHKESDKTQIAILKAEQGINKLNMTASDATDSSDQRKKALDNIQKFLDILRNMNPQI